MAKFLNELIEKNFENDQYIIFCITGVGHMGNFKI